MTDEWGEHMKVVNRLKEEFNWDMTNKFEQGEPAQILYPKVWQE